MKLATLASCITMAIGACGKGHESNVNIVGGIDTSYYPGVLRFLTDLDSSRFCTGVVVSETTALIAGHCIKNSTLEHQIYAERPSYMGPGGLIKSNKIYFWTALGNQELLNDKSIARDLAVVVFDDAPFKIEGATPEQPHIKLAREALMGNRTMVKSQVTLVGYGANELGNTKGARNSLGTKRMGTNEIAGLRDGFYTVKSKISEASQPHRAIAAAGDAGAPLLNAEGYLIGIGAGFMLTDEALMVTAPLTDEDGFTSHSTAGAVYAFNAFVDLSSAASRRLLEYAAWQGRPGHGHVIIPGINPTSEVKLADDDHYWTELNPHLKESIAKDNAPDLETVSTWVAMTGGGAFRTTAGQGLALQGLLPGECMPGYIGPRTLSAADCASRGGPTLLGPVGPKPAGPQGNFADNWRNPAFRDAWVQQQRSAQPKFDPKPQGTPPNFGAMRPAVAQTFGGPAQGFNGAPGPIGPQRPTPGPAWNPPIRQQPGPAMGASGFGGPSWPGPPPRR